MEGAAGEDAAAPDSWESADLEERMSRLLVPSRRAASSPELADELPAPAPANAAAGVGAGGAGGGNLSEELIAQVDQFLREALEKPRERLSVLRMEQDIEKFIRDPRQQQLEFQGLPTSYLRLAAHRLGQHYFLQSTAVPDNILPDGSGSRIILHKTSYECRLPAVRLADIPVNLPQEENNFVAKVAIKQRPNKQFQTSNNSNAHSSKGNQQKSVEERKEEYNRARARIFNSNGSSSMIQDRKPVDEPTLPTSLHRSSSLELNSGHKSSFEGPENTPERGLPGSSLNNRPSRSKSEKEPVVSRQRASNRVAIFRDREVDHKDPDYDRNYDRYMQRFDPGFGFNGGSYTIQPLYSPAVNYNTEFPQLGSGHRSPIPVEQQPCPMPQHMPGPWSTASAPTAIGYRPPEGIMAPFNPSHVGGPVRSSIFMHPSQYSIPSRPGVSFVHPQDPMQPFVQAHQQQPEASFGLARPR